MATALTDRDIARWRLRSQRLAAPYACSAREVVGHLLAVQAENPAQSAWAVAARTAGPDRADLAGLLDSGAVVRTHVLRSTWHYVLAEDICWLLDVTSPRILRVTDQQLRNTVGLDDADVARACTVVLDSLADRADQTRGELGETLHRYGFEPTGFLPMILMAHLELRALVCSGRRAGEEHTYALMSERVPHPRLLDREEGLAELALRYFTSHGPATERDLAYWATLTVTDVRAGLAGARDRLARFEHDGSTLWHAPGEEPPAPPPEPAGHLLQILDEMYRGYQDSRWLLDAAGIVPRDRETAIGMALVDAQLVAGMKRTVAPRQVTFALRPHRPLDEAEVAALDAAARRYGDFLGLPARLTIA